MRLAPTFGLLAGLLVLLASGAAADRAAPTADEILERNLVALGGRAKVKAVRTLRFTATQWSGGAQGKGLTVKVDWKRPDRLRIETPEDGILKVQGFDGTTGWSTYPELQGFEPDILTGTAREALREQADLVEGPTFDYAAKGNRIELVGKESLDGREAWHLRLTTARGERRSLWFDGGSFLQVREERSEKLGDGEVTTVSKFSDFRPAGGLLFAHRTETLLRRPGEPADGIGEPSLFTIDRLEVDVEIPDERFSVPAPTAAPPPKSGTGKANGGDKGGPVGQR
jgi:outer membrane lipoprotein-sorting protein